MTKAVAKTSSADVYRSGGLSYFVIVYILHSEEGRLGGGDATGARAPYKEQL